HGLFQVVAALMLMTAVAVAAEQSPNIVLIVADDLGHGDVGCFGSTTIATPRLDAMGRGGLRFTDFFVAAPVLSPSRGSVLAGGDCGGGIGGAVGRGVCGVSGGTSWAAGG